MSDKDSTPAPRNASADSKEKVDRRELLGQFGRFAGVTAPAVVLLLDATARPASAFPTSGATGPTGPTGV